jgi:hypothetical protein
MCPQCPRYEPPFAPTAVAVVAAPTIACAPVASQVSRAAPLTGLAQKAELTSDCAVKASKDRCRYCQCEMSDPNSLKGDHSVTVRPRSISRSPHVHPTFNSRPAHVFLWPQLLLLMPMLMPKLSLLLLVLVLLPPLTRPSPSSVFLALLYYSCLSTDSLSHHVSTVPSV